MSEPTDVQIIDDLYKDIADLHDQLSTKQKQQLVAIAIAVLSLLLNVLGIDVPVVPTV